MIFVDSNIPMYLIGAAHPHRTDAQMLLEKAIASGQRLVTDAEVLQEVLHRYVAINRRNAITPAIRLILDVVDEVYPVGLAEVLRASEIAQHPAALSARDAVHLAIMEHNGIGSILSFDADFDRWPGITRLHQV